MQTNNKKADVITWKTWEIVDLEYGMAISDWSVKDIPEVLRLRDAIEKRIKWDSNIIRIINKRMDQYRKGEEYNIPIIPI